MAGNVVTYTHPRGSAMESGFASGKIVCDGNIAYVECGFIPAAIKLTVNDATAGYDWIAEWTAGMDEGWYSLIAHDGTDTVLTLAESGGPTPYAGAQAITGDTEDTDADAVLPGFVIPAALLTVADVVFWKASR